MAKKERNKHPTVHKIKLTIGRHMSTMNEKLRQEKALSLYEQGEEKENTGLMRDAIILYKAAIKVSVHRYHECIRD